MKKSDNELIAEFDELYSEKVHGKMLWTHKDNNGESWSYAKHELEYDKSWDWLMPVVEKIESLGYSTRILDVGMGIEGKIIIERFGKTKIEGTYNTVISFIKLYNLNKK